MNALFGDALMVGKLRCPIGGEKATPLDKIGDAEGFDCMNHGRFRVTGSALTKAFNKDKTKLDWETALRKAKARQPGVWAPTINTDDFR